MGLIFPLAVGLPVGLEVRKQAKCKIDSLSDLFAKKERACLTALASTTRAKVRGCGESSPPCLLPCT